MTPHNTILDRIMALIAADTLTLAPAVLAVRVHLAKAAFTPGPALVPASFTEADFTGYAGLLAGVGPQQNFVDPVTGGRVVQLLEPGGGWHWQTTGIALLPMTIFGLWVTDNSNLLVFGSQLLTPPVVLVGLADAVDVAQVRITLPAGVIF